MNNPDETQRILPVETERPTNQSNLSQSNPNKNSWNYFNIINIINLLLIIITIIIFSSIKINDDKNLTNLNAQVQKLRKQLNSLDTSVAVRINALEMNYENIKSQESVFEVSTTENFRTLHGRIDSFGDALDRHERMLIRLSNGTSNADVLDKLKETKSEIDNELLLIENNVYQTLNVASHNVTNRLHENELVLEKTKTKINQQMDETVQKMHFIISDATDHIHEVQSNVTNQLDFMNSKLATTVKDLSNSVEEAQNTIHQEVNVVKDNIEQYVIVTNKQFAAENDFVKYQLAGAFTLLSCLIFLWHLTSHAKHMEKPDVQRRIMAVLWMVPVYGITSWLSMMSPSAEPYLATLRDCFEAYVVYTFIALLIAILSDEMTLSELVRKLAHHVDEEKLSIEKYQLYLNGALTDEENQAMNSTKIVKPTQHLLPPFPCCYKNESSVSIAAAWLYQCQLMAMQFVIMKPLLTVTPLILKISGVFDLSSIPPWENNAINWISPKLYILLIENISVALAFYGLLSFYHGTEKDLEWCDPWPKFLCIKGVVFATFWQNICIQTMSTFGLVDERAAMQIQNLLICIEMLIASIAHFYIFPYHEWTRGYQKAKKRNIILRDTMAFGDFLKDMKLMVTKWDTVHPTNGDGDRSNLEIKSLSRSNSLQKSLSYREIPVKSQEGYEKTEDDEKDAKSRISLSHDLHSSTDQELSPLLDNLEINLSSESYQSVTTPDIVRFKQMLSSPDVDLNVGEKLRDELVKYIQLIENGDPNIAEIEPHQSPQLSRSSTPQKLTSV